MKRVPKAMTIAGSDSGGGAGIQADLKTFAALGVYGTSAITAITAQNTLRVVGVHEIAPEMVSAQIDAIMSDIGADAVKTGMLSSSRIIRVVAEKVREHRLANLVVDPVMVSKGGDRLLQKGAVAALKSELIPLAAVVTPNAGEAEVITGLQVKSLADARKAAEAIVSLGARAVVVKGGHIAGPAVDTLFDGKKFREYSAPRIDTKNTHGTGCTFASAIAAGLAKGLPLEDAISQAKEYVTEAIKQSFSVGHGHGPLNHFHKLWSG